MFSALKPRSIFLVTSMSLLPSKIVLENDMSTIRAFGGRSPEIAKYFETIDQVIFNPDLEINMNWRHIFIERADRIPAEIRDGKTPIKEIVQKFKGTKRTSKTCQEKL